MDFHTDVNFKPLSGEEVTTEQLDKWSQIESKEDLINYYYHVYPDEYYYNYPKFSVNKLGLSNTLLDSLKKTDITRKDIYEWMNSQSFSLEDWIYVGW